MTAPTINQPKPTPTTSGNKPHARSATQRQQAGDRNERRAKATTMRNAGATWASIAKALGISQMQAQRDVAWVMKHWVKIPAEQMVEKQRAIMLDLLRVEYPAALDPSSPRHYPAMDRVLEIMRDERKLFGLDRPTKVELGISTEEFAARARELLKVTGDRPLRELAGEPVVDAEVVETDPEEWSNL